MTTKYINQEVAMLFDSSKCTACKGCQIACKLVERFVLTTRFERKQVHRKLPSLLWT